MKLLQQICTGCIRKCAYQPESGKINSDAKWQGRAASVNLQAKVVKYLRNTINSSIQHSLSVRSGKLHFWPNICFSTECSSSSTENDDIRLVQVSVFLLHIVEKPLFTGMDRLSGICAIHIATPKSSYGQWVDWRHSLCTTQKIHRCKRAWRMCACMRVWVCVCASAQRNQAQWYFVCVEMKPKLRRVKRINNIFLSSSGMLFWFRCGLPRRRTVQPFYVNVSTSFSFHFKIYTFLYWWRTAPANSLNCYYFSIFMIIKVTLVQLRWKAATHPLAAQRLAVTSTKTFYNNYSPKSYSRWRIAHGNERRLEGLHIERVVRCAQIDLTIW